MAYKSKLWDKKTPINGNSAEKIIEAYRVGENQPVGLIYDEDSPDITALIVSNPNYTKADVTRVLKEQLTALNAKPETETETESKPKTDK